MHNKSVSNCHVSVCSQFYQLRFCQILFELVYSWESYRKNRKSELFIETQCTCNERTTDPFGDASCSIDDLLIMLLLQTVNEVFIRLIIIETTANESSQVSSVCESIRIPDGIDNWPLTQVRTTHQYCLVKQLLTRHCTSMHTSHNYSHRPKSLILNDGKSSMEVWISSHLILVCSKTFCHISTINIIIITVVIRLVSNPSHSLAALGFMPSWTVPYTLPCWVEIKIARVQVEIWQ